MAPPCRQYCFIADLRWSFGDSFATTIYTDGSTIHGNTNDVTCTLSQKVTLQPTVSALSQPANGVRPFKPKRKLCERPSNWYRRMSPSTRCASFRIVCQYSNEYKICTNPSKLPTPTKTRFLMLWSRLPRVGALSCSHGTLAILESMATSWQM